MDREDFVSREKSSKEFRAWRAKLNNIQDNYTLEENFETLFAQVIKKAGEGDVIMQDVAAYYYKEGVARWLDEDYKKYMNWEILAAAGGNETAIEKLQFFMSYAYDQIIESEVFPQIKYYNKIDEYNYIYIIGQRLCEELASELGLNCDELAKQKDDFVPYAPEHFRDYRRSVDRIIPVVIEKMKEG